jgi:hypothetical protein
VSARTSGTGADVFRPFFRLDDARNQDEGGTGLGLAITLDIARSHGGDITLGDSRAGGCGQPCGCRCGPGPLRRHPTKSRSLSLHPEVPTHTDGDDHLIEMAFRGILNGHNAPTGFVAKMPPSIQRKSANGDRAEFFAPCKLCRVPGWRVKLGSYTAARLHS